MGESSTSADDLPLLRRCQEGDTVAFDELITRHREKMHMIAWQIVRNEEDALDVVQDAFVRAWRSLPKLKIESTTSFPAWMRRIVTNAAIDLCRRRQARPQVEIEDQALKIDAASHTTPAAMEAPGTSVDREFLRNRIAAAMEALSPEHRAVIMLKEIEDLSYDEIARTVGCSLGTVMSRLFYARKKLQSLLDDLHGQI